MAGEAQEWEAGPALPLGTQPGEEVPEFGLMVIFTQAEIAHLDGSLEVS